jgi:hypothetical protein
MKDVLHVLDLWAENDKRYRFIFSGLRALLKECNKRRVRNNLKPCQMRHLKKVLALLRKLHILSPYFTSWDGRYGFIFEPHDARRTVEHDVCIKHAYEGMDPYGALGEPPQGHHRGTSRGTVMAPFVAPQATFRGTARDTIDGTIDSAKPTDYAELTDEQVTEWLAIHAPEASPKVLKSSKVLKVEGSKGLESTGDLDRIKEQLQPQMQERQAVVVSSRTTGLDKEQRQNPEPSPPAPGTIGIHFADAIDVIDRLTDGELDPNDYHCKDDFQEWSVLAESARAAIDVKKDRPYLGLQTNAAIMRDTMKMLKKYHGLNVPEPWLPIMDEMQHRTPEMKAEKVRKKALAEREAQNERALQELRASTERWRQEHGYERCADEIWRPEADRKTYGWTILGEDGVWQQDPVVGARVNAESQARREAEAKRHGIRAPRAE